MKDGSAYEFTPLPYEGSVVFNFCDRNKSGAPLFRAKDPADWYAHLSKEGVKNIFMIMGMKVNRQALGFSNNSAVSIFVRYNDNVVTRFVPHWSFNDDARLWSVEYTEAVAENAPATDPDFRNEKSLTLATLSDIGELAQQPLRGRFKFGQQENEVEIRQRLGDGKVVPVYEIGGTQQPSAPVPPVIPVHTPETQPAQPAAPVVTEPAPEEAPETTEPAPEAPEAPQAPAAETNANTCPHCGAAVTADGARFCTACGGRLDG